ncbi:MAG: hypothetical protein IJO33_03790 [Bacilli bacterium]|nr:hypothetical protein [Bacilli bacterium]
MGDSFDVNDIGKLYSDIDTLTQTNNELTRLEERLRGELNKVKSAWKSDAQDRTSAIDELQKDINSLRNLTVAIKSLSITLSNFARRAEMATRR